MPCSNIHLIRKRERIKRQLPTTAPKSLQRTFARINEQYNKEQRILDKEGLKGRRHISIHDRMEYERSKLTGHWEEKKRYNEYIPIGCGQCNFCRQARQNDWVTRIMLETEERERNCFLSLTYREEPKTQGYNKINMQQFIKRLRKNEGLHIEEKRIKYLSCGEYGKKNKRIHVHLAILGWKPNDIKYIGKSKKGKPIFESKRLNKIWGHGKATVQQLTPKGIKYITLYATKQAMFTHSMDKEANSELYALIKAMNRGEIQEDKQARETWKRIKMAEFNTFSQGIGFNQFLKNKYLENGYNKIGKREIPNYWLRKILFNNLRKPFPPVIRNLQDIADNSNYYKEIDTWQKAKDEWETNNKIRLQAIKILKDRQDRYNEYIAEKFGYDKDYATYQRTIAGIQGTNAFTNIQDILKSTMKQSWDYF